MLAESPTSEVVVAAMREEIRIHGKPERVYADRGAAFTAWRDVTSCEQVVDEQLIDHSLRTAHRPQGGGKIESARFYQCRSNRPNRVHSRPFRDHV